MFEYFVKEKKFKEVAIKDIDYRDTTTSFSFSPGSDELVLTLKKFGLFNPVYLVEKGGEVAYSLICGHRRMEASLRIGLEKIPSFILNPGPENKSEALLYNVVENRTHRTFNEIEISNVLSKLKGFGYPEEKIVNDVMPILGLEKSKKIYENYLLLQILTGELKEYLVGIGAPLRVAVRPARWKEEDRRDLFDCIGVLKPGVNKLRELIELLEEISLRDGSSPGKVLRDEGVDSICRCDDFSPSDRMRKAQALLWEKRYPILTGKKEMMKGALKALDYPKGTELSYPKNFEGEDLTLSLRFSSTGDFISKLEKMKAEWREEELERIFKILRE